MIYKCYVCPECCSKRTRDLECELHGKDCPLIICCDCGTKVIDRNDIKKRDKQRIGVQFPCIYCYMYEGKQ